MFVALCGHIEPNRQVAPRKTSAEFGSVNHARRALTVKNEGQEELDDPRGGDENRRTSMSDDFQSLVMAHVKAVTRLLLGDKGMQPSLAILGVEPLNDGGRIGLAHMAAASQTDLVVLEFDPRATGRLEIVGINVVVERDGKAYVQSGCRLWKGNNGRRGIILPTPGSRGHFRLSPREILHVDSAPGTNAGAGVDRASGWLRAQVRASHPNPLGVGFWTASKETTSPEMRG